jgi:hypothetical protein
MVTGVQTCALPIYHHHFQNIQNNLFFHILFKNIYFLMIIGLMDGIIGMYLLLIHRKDRYIIIIQILYINNLLIFFIVELEANGGINVGDV